MVFDDGEECSSVIVPLSLIMALKDAMLGTIDRWHEDRDIEDLNVSQCIVAMMAAGEAASEEMLQYPDGATIQ
jgi:hypothetical protein